MFGQKISVLIAFSEENIINLLKMAINTKYNASIDIASDVPEFKKHTTATVYDVIFIDIVYSQDIFTAIEEFRGQEKNSEIPVVFFTTHLKETDRI